MKSLFLCLICFLFHASSFSQAANISSKFRELEFISISQLEIKSGSNLEPSGIILFQDKLYVISDEATDKYLYQIKIDAEKWVVVDSIDLQITDRIDLEAIDYCVDQIYLLSESSGSLLVSDSGGKINKIAIDFGDEEPFNWGNAGWEGLATDCKNNTLYLIKERQPRKILRVNLATQKIEDNFNIPESESNDFSDAKFENGYLYLIERNGNYITKVNPITHEVIEKLSYRETCSHKNGKLYEPYAYGMAEGLLLKKDEIWLTLDNNNLNASGHASKTFGISGNHPVILKFKRPMGF
ncbi:MAG: hypothetical protein ACJA2S_003042 [Cyclobacteriaceae bacterium]|jgi:uncharacterized protein YjiK